MKKTIIGLLVSVFVSATLFAATEYKLDKSHSYVGFKIKHLGFATVRGEFEDFSTEIVLGSDEETRFAGEVQVASIDTSNEKRDDHLRSGDFFEADLFPRITFASTKVTRVNDNLLMVDGKLTIKDVTKEITIPFSHSPEFKGPGVLKPTNRRVFESEFTINRKDYNINFSKLVDGNLVVGDDVTIIIEIEGIEK